MTNRERTRETIGNDGERDPDLAPETFNDEQEDESTQTQSVAAGALEGQAQSRSPLDSVKTDDESGLMNDSTQDLIDHMRDMESSGRIDMDAYQGEPNMDDNEDKYGRSNKIDPDLTGDGADVPEASSGQS